MIDGWSFPANFPDECDGLKIRYREEGRHYHTWDHIQALLRWFADVSGNLHDPKSVELAIYYHDAIYDPMSAENETESASLLRAELGGKVPAGVLQTATAFIEATQKHQLPNRDDALFLSDCGWFLDMDISILGADPVVFGEYEDQIRLEYAHVPDELFRPGRSAILKGFLARERLYFTEFFQDRLERKARENLSRSIERLSE